MIFKCFQIFESVSLLKFVIVFNLVSCVWKKNQEHLTVTKGYVEANGMGELVGCSGM